MRKKRGREGGDSESMEKQIRRQREEEKIYILVTNWFFGVIGKVTFGLA